jgi:hypothetical protein
MIILSNNDQVMTRDGFFHNLDIITIHPPQADDVTLQVIRNAFLRPIHNK